MTEMSRDDICAALDQEVIKLSDTLHGIEVKALAGQAKALAAEEGAIDSQLRRVQLLHCTSCCAACKPKPLRVMTAACTHTKKSLDTHGHRLAQLEETVAKLKAQGRERELALYQEVNGAAHAIKQ